MADLDAKRDARRKRILENSENRLRKITSNGSNNCEEKPCQNQDDGFKCNNRVIDTGNGSSSTSAVSSMCNGINKMNKSVNGVLHTSPNLEKLIPSSTAYKSVTEKVDLTSCSTLKSTRTLPHILLSNRLNYVLLAAIVNVMLALKLSHLFGKTITIPYFTLMVGRLCTVRDVQENHDDNLLVAALILCNINPELTYKLKRLVTLFTLILSDLALYIFSFTLMRYTIYYWLHDPDVPISN
ncbi:hypothetical protein KM043_001595 [Ampulex compressa]|nr:hypothetical protein KM043_001595 [Ampulex compressa]